MPQRIELRDLELAFDRLRLMKYPPPENSKPALMDELAKMCPSPAALEWLIGELVNHVKEWPGIAEVRGLLCTRFDAADGVDTYCSLPGYSQDEYEAKHYEQHRQLTTAQGWSDEEVRGQLRQLAAKPPKSLPS